MLSTRPRSARRLAACTLAVRGAGLATVTDLGRPGLARQGIPAGGAADQYSAAVANILVGNPRTEPLIEVTAADFSLAADRPALVAVTGSPARVTAGDRPVRPWTPVDLYAGERLSISDIHRGFRVYLAVNGRWDVPRLFGSCAPDPRLGFGVPLPAGATVAVHSAYRPIDHPVLRHPVFCFDVAVPRLGDPLVVDVTRGPDGSAEADAVLASAHYTVHHDSDQVGLRLSGPAPGVARGEVLSKGVPAGGLEVPPGGGLVLLLRGRPVTAGYPVVAVATRVAQSALGQAGPGRDIRLRWRTVGQAVSDHRRQREALSGLTVRVRTAFGTVGIPYHADRGVSTAIEGMGF